MKKILYTIAILVTLVASCSKGDEPVHSNPATRAITHADSVRLGLIIELKADSAWDGTIDINF